MQQTQTMIRREMALVPFSLPPVAIDEDVIRQSLIDAIAVIQKAMHSGDGWFKIIKAGQDFLVNAQVRLNKELDALLRGEYLRFCANQLAEGRRREERGR
jgi:hypothetical protein